MTHSNSTNPGEAFRLTREKLGLSINDVAIATKISPRVLKALEAGDKESLPANSFARGFIRSYASYLKIKSQPILDAYNLTDGIVDPNINTDMSAPILENNSKVESPAPTKRTLPNLGDSQIKSKVLLVGGLILIIVLFVGIKNIFDKYAHERILDPAFVEENETEATGEAATDATPDGRAAVEATKKEAEAEKSTDTEKSTETEKSRDAEISTAAKDAAATTAAAPAPTKALKPTAAEAEAPTFDEKPAPTPVVNQAKINAEKAALAKAEEAKKTEDKKEIKPADAVTLAKPKPNTPQEVILEALDSVEINMIVDGANSKKIKLQPESVYTIKANSTIELDIKDGGMVNIIHNGRDKGVPGDLGKSAKVKFP